ALRPGGIDRDSSPLLERTARPAHPARKEGLQLARGDRRLPAVRMDEGLSAGRGIEPRAQGKNPPEMEEDAGRAELSPQLSGIQRPGASGDRAFLFDSHEARPSVMYDPWPAKRSKSDRKS